MNIEQNPANQPTVVLVQSNRLQEVTTGQEKVGAKETYEQMKNMQKHVAALLLSPRVCTSRRPCEVTFDIVCSFEREKIFPYAQYAFAGSLLTLKLARFVESAGKHWIGQLEGNRSIQWEGPWRPIADVANYLRQEAPQSFRTFSLRMPDDSSKTFRIFTRSVRLDHYGRKRIVIVHEQKNLSDTPLFLFTDALFWEGRRIVECWQYRWEEQLFTAVSDTISSH